MGCSNAWYWCVEGLGDESMGLGKGLAWAEKGDGGWSKRKKKKKRRGERKKEKKKREKKRGEKRKKRRRRGGEGAKEKKKKKGTRCSNADELAKAGDGGKKGRSREQLTADRPMRANPTPEREPVATGRSTRAPTRPGGPAASDRDAIARASPRRMAAVFFQDSIGLITFGESRDLARCVRASQGPVIHCSAYQNCTVCRNQNLSLGDAHRLFAQTAMNAGYSDFLSRRAAVLQELSISQYPRRSPSSSVVCVRAAPRSGDGSSVRQQTGRRDDVRRELSRRGLNRGVAGRHRRHAKEAISRSSALAGFK